MLEERITAISQALAADLLDVIPVSRDWIDTPEMVRLIHARLTSAIKESSEEKDEVIRRLATNPPATD